MRRCRAAEKREKKRQKRYNKLTAEVDDGRVVAARPFPVQAPKHGGRNADGAAGARRALGAGDARVEGGAKGESHFFLLLLFPFFLQVFRKSDSAHRKSF